MTFLEVITFKAVGVVLLLLNPRFLASFSQASPYPSPSNLIFLDALIYSLNTLKTASSFFRFFDSLRRSTSCLNSFNCFATMVFKTVIGPAQFAEDPTALNSNLFPVKANGEVLLISVLSNSISGILPIIFSFKSVFSFGDNFPLVTFSNSSKTAES